MVRSIRAGAIRDDRHKLIVLDNGRQMLFDLEADFSEQRDLLREPGGDATANRLRNLAEKLRSSGELNRSVPASASWRA